MNKKIVFIKNFSSLSVNQGINILVAIIATPILFQNLGESSFGLINLSLSIFILLSIVFLIFGKIKNDNFNSLESIKNPYSIKAISSNISLDRFYSKQDDKY